MATNGQLHGDLSYLQRASSMAGNVSTTLSQYQTRMNSAADQIASQWQGTALPAFQNAHATWQQSMNKLVASLSQLGENTNYSSNTYQTADQTAASSFSAVQPFHGALNA